MVESLRVYYLYVLRSLRDERLYTRITADVERRLGEHNAGRVKSTRSRRPLEVVYTETFENRRLATARERYFKTAEGGALKQRLIAGSE